MHLFRAVYREDVLESRAQFVGFHTCWLPPNVQSGKRRLQPNPVLFQPLRESNGNLGRGAFVVANRNGDHSRR